MLPYQPSIHFMLNFLYATMHFSICYHVGEENNDDVEDDEDVMGLMVEESETEEKVSEMQKR